MKHDELLPRQAQDNNRKEAGMAFSRTVDPAARKLAQHNRRAALSHLPSSLRRCCCRRYRHLLGQVCAVAARESDSILPREEDAVTVLQDGCEACGYRHLEGQRLALARCKQHALRAKRKNNTNNSFFSDAFPYVCPEPATMNFIRKLSVTEKRVLSGRFSHTLKSKSCCLRSGSAEAGGDQNAITTSLPADFPVQ